MHSIPIPDLTFMALSRLAASLNTTPESLAVSTLDQLVVTKAATEPSPVLTGEAWQAEWKAMLQAANARADRYPPGFVLDDSRETMYEERLGRQL